RPGRGAAVGQVLAGLPDRGDPADRVGVSDASHAELARVGRDHAGRRAAALVPLTGDFTTAEDLVQDAVEAALRHWPVEGIPDRPDGWLFTGAHGAGPPR